MMKKADMHLLNQMINWTSSTTDKIEILCYKEYRRTSVVFPPEGQYLNLIIRKHQQTHFEIQSTK